MGELADRLDRMIVEATSPDGKITSRVRGQGETIDVAFQPGAYDRYRESDLADQLARLATLTFVRYRRDEQEIVDAAFALPVDDRFEFGSERRRYIEAVKQLVAVGASDDGRINITSRCLVTWEVSVADGALDRWSEREFVAALVGAVHRLLLRYKAQVFALKDEIYDLGYPDSLRQAIGIGPRGDIWRSQA
jgi:hypothetical protein